MIDRIKTENVGSDGVKVSHAERVISITKDTDISSFTGEKVRYHFQHVKYRNEARELEATDGRLLIRVEIADQQPDLGTDVYIPAAALKETTKNAKPEYRGGIPKIRLSTETVTAGGLECNVEKAAEWPNTDEVLPDPQATPPVISLKLGAGLLRKLCEHAARHGNDGTDTAISFDFYDPRRAIGFRYQTRYAGAAYGLIMPVTND